jgi:hypothetical protein
MHDIAGQLTFYALPAGIFWLISWLLLTLLQRLAFVDSLSRKHVIWFSIGGVAFGFILGLVSSLENGPTVY